MGCPRLNRLTRLGDPLGEFADAWAAKEAVRDTYGGLTETEALDWVTRLGEDLQAERLPETRRLGRTITPQHHQPRPNPMTR